jgi:hypothetical protein
MMANLASEELTRRLDKALELAGNTHTIEDIQHLVARGAMQCFVQDDSFVITEIVNEPRAKYLNVFLAVGEMSVVNLIPKIEAFAQEAGCAWVQTLGRPGWKSVLPKYGWEPTHVLFVHPIGNKNGQEI